MVSIQVDEKTAKAIEMAATVAGLSVAEYVSSLVSTRNTSTTKDSWDPIEKQFVELSVDGLLPDAFSRDDIYSDYE